MSATSVPASELPSTERSPLITDATSTLVLPQRDRSGFARLINVRLAVGVAFSFAFLVTITVPWMRTAVRDIYKREVDSGAAVLINSGVMENSKLTKAQGRGAVNHILRDLDDQIVGKVVFREDKALMSQSTALLRTDHFDSANNLNFAVASHVWNQCGMNEAPPIAVIEVANERDVQKAVTTLAHLSLHHNISWRIRSGGHSYAGWSTVPDGIILSLSGLNQIQMLERPEDSHSRSDSSVLVTLGPAVRVQDELLTLLQPHHLGSVMGWCGTVGVGGYTLGGGNGAWARQYGLGLDQVVAARVVLANGTLLTANSSHHSDLFWALRGAGQNNFGVVTQITYRFYPSQDDLIMASFLINASSATNNSDSSQAAAVLHRLAQIEHSLSGQMGAFIGAPWTSPANPDEPPKDDVFGVLIWYVSQTKEQVEKGQDELRKVLSQLAVNNDTNSVAMITGSWTKFTVDNAPFHDNRLVRIWNGFLFPDQISPTVCNSIMTGLRRACQASPYTLSAIELWGGAIADVDPNSTAFFWRQAVYNVRIVLLVPANLTNAVQIYHDTVAKLEPFWKSLSKYLNGTYTNYAMASLSQDEYARVTFGGNLERLQVIKQQYDPDNIFRHPHSVVARS